MQNLFSELEKPLPETLLEDLADLLNRDNNCYLTWVDVDSAREASGTHWFTVEFSSDGYAFGLRLKFWIPGWMHERGVRAILPAHLAVSDCRAGREATVALPMTKRSELLADLPRIARTCARLINELWGPTGSDRILLRALDYQATRLDTPFPELPGYHL